MSNTGGGIIGAQINDGWKSQGMICEIEVVFAEIWIKKWGSKIRGGIISHLRQDFQQFQG